MKSYGLPDQNRDVRGDVQHPPHVCSQSGLLHELPEEPLPRTLAESQTPTRPPHVLWAALVAPLASGGRPWFELQEDEVEPAILEAREPGQVMWSTLWRDRPDDRIELRLLADREGSRLTFTRLSPGPTPEGATLDPRRRRLNELFWAGSWLAPR